MSRGIVKGGLNDGGSNIKSIQTGSLVADSTLSYSVAISAVDPTKSIVIVEMAKSTTYIRNAFLCAEIQDSTHILIDCVVAPDNVTVKWWVIEFNNVKSLQKGSIGDITAIDTAITISSVDPSKCLVSVNFIITGSTSTCQLFQDAIHTHSLTATQLTISQSRVIGTADYKKYKWQVVEFY